LDVVAMAIHRLQTRNVKHPGRWWLERIVCPSVKKGRVVNALVVVGKFGRSVLRGTFAGVRMLRVSAWPLLMLQSVMMGR